MSLLRPNRPAHGDLLDVQGAPVRLRVNPRARRISLRIDGARGEGVAVAPSARSLPQAIAFARSRADWLAERLAARPAVVALKPGAVIPLRGRPTLLGAAGGRVSARLEAEVIAAGGDGDAYARRVRRLLLAEALADLRLRTAEHASALGRPVPPVSLINARTRWGSCSPAQAGRPARIRYNWRLILTPPPVLDYVVAHEVAHLVEANHAPAFWAVVTRLYGDPAEARLWLKRNGAALHAYA